MYVAGAELQQGQQQAAAPGAAGESSRMAGQGSSATLGGPTVQAPSRQSFQQDAPSSGPSNAWQQRRASPAHAAPGAPSTSQALGQQQQEPQVNNCVSMEAANIWRLQIQSSVDMCRYMLRSESSPLQRWGSQRSNDDLNVVVGGGGEGGWGIGGRG